MKTKGLLVVLAIFSSLPVGAQVQNTGATTSQHLVTVPFFVTDQHGKAATDVSLKDFTIKDEGQSVEPMFYAASNGGGLPLRLGVVIDGSNSQRTSDVYRAAAQAFQEFLVRAMRDSQDQVFFERFDSAVDPPTDWMNSEQARHMNVEWQPRGASTLFDALDTACQGRMALQPFPTRHILVLLTDGDDNSSRTDLKGAIASAQQSGTVIFVVSTIDDSAGRQREQPGGMLKRLATETGGQAYLHLRPKDLPRSSRTLLSNSKACIS